MSQQSDFASFVAGAAITGYTIVKHSGSARGAVPATAGTDKLIGAADRVGAASGQMIDVVIGDIGLVSAGAAIAAGDPITVDATSRAVTAGKVNAVTTYVIGFALEAANAAGDIIQYKHAPFVIVG